MWRPVVPLDDVLFSTSIESRTDAIFPPGLFILTRNVELWQQRVFEVGPGHLSSVSQLLERGPAGSPAGLSFFGAPPGVPSFQNVVDSAVSFGPSVVAVRGVRGRHLRQATLVRMVFGSDLSTRDAVLVPPGGRSRPDVLAADGSLSLQESQLVADMGITSVEFVGEFRNVDDRIFVFSHRVLDCLEFHCYHVGIANEYLRSLVITTW